MKRLKKQSDINNITNKEGNLNIEYDNDDKIHENLSIESDASFLKKQDDDNLKKLNNNPFIIESLYTNICSIGVCCGSYEEL